MEKTVMSKYSKEEQRWRTRYSKISSYLRGQYSALQEKYPWSKAFNQFKPSDFESLKQLGPEYPFSLIKKRVRMFEQVKRSGALSLQKHRRMKALAVRTLKEQYDIVMDEDMVRGYFKFMDDLKARGIVEQRGSGEWADTYITAYNRGITGDELRENIKTWAKGFAKKEKEGLSYQVQVRHYPKVSSAKMRRK